MSKIRKATRAMLGVFLIATLMMPAGMVERVFADEGSGVKNPDVAVLDDGVVQIYNLKNGETKTIVGGLRVGDYSVRETGTTYNTVNIEDYATSYSQDKFSIGRDWVNIAGPIDVIVTNRYEEVIAEEPEQVATTEPVMTAVDPCLVNECGKGAAVKAPETGKASEQSGATVQAVDMNIVVAVLGAAAALLMAGVVVCAKRK